MEKRGSGDSHLLDRKSAVLWVRAVLKVRTRSSFVGMGTGFGMLGFEDVGAHGDGGSRISCHLGKS